MSEKWSSQEVTRWEMEATRLKGSTRKTLPCGCRIVEFRKFGAIIKARNYCEKHGKEL